MTQIREFQVYDVSRIMHTISLAFVLLCLDH